MGERVTIISSGMIISGGTLELSSGAGGTGPITFAAANGVLQIDGAAMPANVISGLASGDTIDLAGVNFTGGGSIGLAPGNVLQAEVNGSAYSLLLDPSENFSGDSFRLSSDGSGGTAISLVQGMSINVTYDSSVTTAANAAAIEGAVAAAVQFLENTFTNPITLNIDVGFGEVNGSPIVSSAVAESESNRISTTYAAITSALSAGAISADQIAAAAGLPASDPTSSGSWVIARAEAKALGLLAGTDDSVVDGYVGLSSATSFTFDPNNRTVSGMHDAIGALEHEITEVMGRVGSLGQHDGPNVYTPIDLFRYSAPGERQLVYGPGYFSINGQTLLTPYNNPSSGGDAVDWLPALVGDSFGDSYTGVASLMGATDVEEMNVLGYDVAFGATVSSGQTFTVSAGQTETSLIVLSGGILNVLSGGSVVNTLDSGGTVYISSGGAASGTAVFRGGSVNVFSGGTTTATAIDNGGLQIVEGGVVSTTAINIGGTMVLASGNTHASLNEGTFIFSGGTHSATGLTGNGEVVVSSGALLLSLTSSSTFSGTFVLDGGGTLELTSAVAAGGRPIDFAAAGTTLRIDGSSMPSDVISGFAPNEVIDLAGVSFDSGGAATLLSGNVLQIVESGQTYDLQLDSAQSFASEQFHLASDGATGTDITVTSGAVVGSGQTLIVSSGQTSNGVVVLSGGTLLVLSGGTASGTVDSGGTDVVLGVASGTALDGGGIEVPVSGGTADGAAVNSGGTEVVASGGTASGLIVSSGGIDVVISGGTEIDTTVLSGGLDIVDGGTALVLAGSVASGAIVLSSGVELIESGGAAGGVIAETSGVLLVLSGGAASGAIITSSGVDVVDGGAGSGAIVNSGGVEVLVSGGTATGTIVGSGGVEVVAAGGSARGVIVGSGGVDVVVSGGTQSGTAIGSSGVDIVVSGTASGTIVGSGGYELVESGSIDSAVTISGGTFEVAGGGVTGSGPVTFAGGGTLQLDASVSFGGLVAGFGALDQLDLRDIAVGSNTHVSFTEASGGASGTLTVTDGVHTANIELLGQYSQFAAASDNNGGTIISDPPPGVAASVATALLASPHHT
jgi:autotransporter passenger strand-loop-strand repeat protein